MQALIKKHEAVELEIEGYGGKVQELVTESQTLLNREHFDQEMIQKKQVHMIPLLLDLIQYSLIPRPLATFFVEKKWGLAWGQGYISMHVTGRTIVWSFHVNEQARSI